MKPKVLNGRMAAVYRYILAFKAANDGNSPTVRQIGDACNITSTAVVRYYLNRLIEAGRIEMPLRGASRMIVVPGATWLVPGTAKGE